MTSVSPFLPRTHVAFCVLLTCINRTSGAGRTLSVKRHSARNCQASETSMLRIALRFDALDRVAPSPYAVLQIEPASRKWMREGYVGLELPEWGTLIVDAGNALICGPHDMTPHCVLEGLELEQHRHVSEGETGPAHWCGTRGLALEPGRWLIRRVEARDDQPPLPAATAEAPAAVPQARPAPAERRPGPNHLSAQTEK